MPTSSHLLVREMSYTISSGRVPVTCLKQIFRQSKESSIVTYAHAVNRGDIYLEEELLCSKVSDLTDCNPFQFVDLQDQTCSDVVGEIYEFARKLERDPHVDIQILAPMYGGPSGIDDLNDKFQKELNPESTSCPSTNELKFQVGDKVMQTKNDYERDIFNGTVGFIAEIKKDDVTVEFDGTLITKDVVTVNFDGTLIEYSQSDLHHLTLAYAISIHKSQGSEYKCVIVVLTMGHSYLLQRKVLYTAITRAKEKLIVVGDRKAYEHAILKDDVEERCTLLCHLLSQ